MPAPPKVVRPDAGHLCARQRLDEVLAEALRHGSTWVVGPAGAGKTCAAAKHVADSGRPCMWLHLDADDAEPATFFHFMAQAARLLKPGLRLPVMLPEHGEGLATFARGWFRTLAGALPADALIVLDNYEALPDGARLHAVIADAIEQSPQEVSWIVASRHAPPEAFARLRASARLSLLSWQHLRLTRDEALALAQHHRGSAAVDAQFVEAAYAMHQGWVAGLLLALESQGGRDSAPGVPPEDAGADAAFDFFAAEVFRELPPQRRRFLLETAVLPEMTARDARELTGEPDAAAVLEQLSRRNHFTFRLTRRALLGPSTTWYRYHPLFRRFLLERAAAELDPAQSAALRVRAGRMLAGRGQFEEAIELLRVEGQWDELAALLRGHADRMLEQGRHEVLRAWLSDVPQTASDEARGWLAYYLGCARMPFDPVEARTHHATAFACMVRTQDAAGTFLSWAGAAEALLYGWGSFRDYDAWLVQLDERLALHEPPTLAIEGRLAATVHGALMFRRPNDPAIAHWEKRVRRFLHLSRALDPNHYVMLAINLFHHDLWRGHVARAHALLESLEGAVRSKRTGPVAMLAFRTMNAVYGHFTGDGAMSVRAADSGLEFAQQSGVHFWDFLLLAQAAFGAIVLGDTAAAQLYLGRMRERLHPERQLEQLLYADAAAQTALALGDERAALAYAEQAVEFAVQLGALFPEAILRTGVSQTLFACGRLAQAREELDRAQALAESAQSSVLVARCHLARAQYLLHAHEEGAALAELTRGFALCREYGYYGLPWWRAPEMGRLAAVALRAGVEREFVAELIRRRELPMPEDMGPLPDWPFQVKVFTLASSLSVWVGGKQVKFSGKAQRRPLELLQALVAFGGEASVEARLGEALWPDSEGDAAHQAVATTLHRLRKLIGAAAVRRTDQKLELDPAVVWVDAHACEHTWEREAPGSVMLLESLALYRAPFLASSDGAWTLSRRQRLRDKYTRAVLRSATALCETGSDERALQLLHDALDVEPGVEALYRSAIALLRGMARDAEAADLYRRCRAQLRLHHGCEPSAETARLANDGPSHPR